MPLGEQIDMSEFEFDRICTPYAAPCNRVAEWLLVAQCCGSEMPLCHPHKLEADREHEMIDRARAKDPTGRKFCAVCDAEGDDVVTKWVKL